MFSDIRSFTTFSERMDAKALSQFLNDYLTIMSEIVKRNDGTLDKYIGDAVMAFWGAPLAQPAHASNAARAAIEMQQALAQHRPRFVAQYGIEVDIGVGLNTGVVTVGNMGGKDNFSYTVIGDHVNLASRMEGLTKPYASGIVTSRYTFDSMMANGQTPPPHRVLDFVKVKGKKQAVELIQLLEREYGPKGQEGLEVFQKARAAYVAQKWDDAAALFHQANALIAEDTKSDDGPSLMYLERIEELRKEPPGAGWDGAWEMKSK